jgi:hypothetical protein
MLLLKTLSNEGAAALSLRVVDDLRARSDGDLPVVAYEHLTTAFVVQGDLDQAERTMRMRPTSWWGVARDKCVASTAFAEHFQHIFLTHRTI